MPKDTAAKSTGRNGPRENVGAGRIPTDLLRRALSAAAEGITISDPSLPDNPLVYVNEGFEKLTGYTSGDVLGKNCRFLQGAQTDPAASEEIRTAIREQRPCLVELINHRKDGSPFWNRLSITPIRDSAGSVTHFIGVQSDITERRDAEEALRLAKNELQEANKDMSRALESAAAVQMALLPRGFRGGEGIRIAWRLQACATLAGDILNAFWLDDTHLGCYILDVMGHGVPAALLSVTLSHFLSPRSKEAFLLGPNIGPEQALDILSPANVGERLNKRFPLDPENMQFFTILYGILDTETLMFRFFTAGHPPMIHTPRNGAPAIVPSSGFPIGVVDAPGYRDEILHLRSGDRLLLYSDGVTEAQNQQGLEFGTHALCDIIEATRAKPLDESLELVLDRVRSWSAGSVLRDDVSVLAMEAV